RLILEINIRKLLTVVVAHDESRHRCIPQQTRAAGSGGPRPSTQFDAIQLWPSLQGCEQYRPSDRPVEETHGEADMRGGDRNGGYEMHAQRSGSRRARGASLSV